MIDIVSRVCVTSHHLDTRVLVRHEQVNSAALEYYPCISVRPATLQVSECTPTERGVGEGWKIGPKFRPCVNWVRFATAPFISDSRDAVMLADEQVLVV